MATTGYAVYFGSVLCGVKKFPHALAIYDRKEEAEDYAMRLRGSGQQYQVREVAIKVKTVKAKKAGQ